MPFHAYMLAVIIPLVIQAVFTKVVRAQVLLGAAAQPSSAGGIVN